MRRSISGVTTATSPARTTSSSRRGSAAHRRAATGSPRRSTGPDGSSPSAAVPVSSAPASSSRRHRRPPSPPPARLSPAPADRRTGRRPGADTATKVVFATADGLRPAWETVVTSSETPATTVIDAVTGRGPAADSPDPARAQHRPRLEVLPRSAARRAPGQGRLHPAPLARQARPHPQGQQLPHVHRRGRQQPGGEVRGGAPAERPAWSYRLTPFHLGFAKRSAATPGPARGTPTSRSPGGSTGPRTRRRSSTSSTTGTTT